MTFLAVRHVTTYRYRQPVSFGEHRIMFRPRDSYDQRLLDSRIEINPAPSGLRWIHDVFGNCVAIARFSKEASELRFESNIRLDHQPSNAPDFQMEDYAQIYPFAYSAEEMPDLMRTMERQYLDPDHQIHRWVQKFIHQGRPTRTGELLMTLTYAIKESFTYNRRSETGIQNPITTLMLNGGSCRDFAILMIEAVRALGLAARFVSGYIYSPSLDGSGHVGGGSTHAWCQVYLPGAGWVEFDPTNGIIGNRDLIRIAVARDPRQAVPLSGTWMGEPNAFEKMTVEVSVTSSDGGATRNAAASTSPDGERRLPSPESAQ
jgi:transglutaminase-like putative cysteine protease